MSKTGLATIHDVAARAGVSIKTVSRVMNKEPDVRADTRDKVLAAATALEYYPDPSARRLAGRRSWQIALACDHPDPSYLGRVIEGILEACRERDYALVLHGCSFEDPLLARRMEIAVRQSRIDGLVLTPPVGDVPGLCAALGRAAIPHVRLDPDIGNGRGVAIDERQAALDMTDYLIGLGHRRIGHIRGHPGHGGSARREAGYRAALERHGLAVDPDLICEGRSGFASGIEATRALLRLERPPGAIFAASDEMAAAAIQKAMRRGLAVPEDLSVAGFGDSPLARMLSPRLSTVHQPVVDMGRRAAEMLLSALAGPKSAPPDAASTTEILPARLMVRKSTAAPRGHKSI